MRSGDGSYRRHNRVIRRDGKQDRGGRRRIVTGMQNGAYCADFTMPMRIGVECVRERAKLQREQQRPEQPWS